MTFTVLQFITLKKKTAKLSVALKGVPRERLISKVISMHKIASIRHKKPFYNIIQNNNKLYAFSSFASAF